jgi:ABC-type uncharacterized transport system involved in gliding motility auxiliary subunit
MSRIWTIARREIKALFDQPTGYVLLVVFLAVNAFLFFRNAYLTGSASLRPMLDLLPWVFLFFVPAVAMRSLAEDHRSGLLEVVLAQPISEAELVLGKYLGVLITVLGALATTLFIPIGLKLGSGLSWGPVLAQYIGAGLLAAAFAGIGTWASSVSRSQITAFLLGVAVMFVLVLVGLDPLVVGLPPLLGTIAASLGVLSHFESIGRGVLDVRDVLYFFSVAAIFIALAHNVVLRRKLAPRSPAVGRLRLGTALLVAVVVALNLAAGQVGGRLDLTPGHAYTLSSATKRIARSLADVVTIKLFASKELPTEFALQKRDVDDLLRDLRSAGKGKVRVIERDPAGDTTAQNDARRLGITPVQFNVVGQSELQVKEGFLGLAIQHADKSEVIPVIQRTSDLEYRIVSAIRNLIRRDKPVVALLTDPDAGQFSALREELEKAYQVQSVPLSDSTASAASPTLMILVTTRDSVPLSERDKVRSFLQGGGKALIMESGMALNPQMPVAMGRPPVWNEVLKPYGVQVRQDMVYDLRAAEVVGVPTQFGRLIRAYPYFLRAQSTKRSPINAELGEVSLTWTSSVDTTGAKGAALPLLMTTPAAGVSSGTAMIDPSQDFPTVNLAERVLAVQVTPSAAKGSVAPRLVVVGNARFASDEFLRRAPENLAFTLNAVDWLAQDEALLSIRTRDRRPPSLAFSSAGKRDAVKYFNVGGLPVLIALAGALRLARRRRLTSASYRPLSEVVEPA